MLTRRRFFRTAGFGAAAAAAVSGSLPGELLTWAEPPRTPVPGGPILLNSNENPYGPLPSVLAMGNPFLDVNRYPNHYVRDLEGRLSALYKVERENLVIGCGSGEILRLAANAFTEPGKKVVTASPTFEAIGNYARVVHGEHVSVPLTANFTHDLGAMLKATGPDTGLIYICNPNNPTGNVTPRAEIEEFIRKAPRNAHVLVDEAYHDFATTTPGYVSFLERPLDDDRLIVTRTFSKIYGLAGMRLGYAVTSKETAKQMREHSLSFSANAFVIRCALTSLDDSAGHQMAQRRNAADREEFMRQAAARKVKAIPSAANFVMVDTGRPIRSVIDFFKKNNVEIGRPFPPLDSHARISLGKPEEMKEFWRVWDSMA
jgi:histidinol-phosphate aminotransferase